MRSKQRISFSDADAVHLYEWLVMYWHGDENAKTFGGCGSCQHLGKRLEKFIGPKDAAMVRRAVRKNPSKRPDPPKVKP